MRVSKYRAVRNDVDPYFTIIIERCKTVPVDVVDAADAHQAGDEPAEVGNACYEKRSYASSLAEGRGIT